MEKIILSGVIEEDKREREDKDFFIYLYNMEYIKQKAKKTEKQLVKKTNTKKITKKITKKREEPTKKREEPTKKREEPTKKKEEPLFVESEGEDRIEKYIIIETK